LAQVEKTAVDEARSSMGRSSAPEELLLRAPRSAAVLFFFLPALGVALLVFFAAASPPPAKSLFVVPLGPQRSAAAAQRVGVASLPAVWAPRSDTQRAAMMTLETAEAFAEAPRSDAQRAAMMTLMNKESAEDMSLGEGLGDEEMESVEKESREEGVTIEWEDDPYNLEQTKQKLKQEEEMLDNLLALKKKLEMELPFTFVEDLDSSHFAEDAVFKEPHLPPIRGRQNYKRFLRTLREFGNVLFEEPSFGVIRATHHADDGLVKVRWRISGNYQGPFKLLKSSTGYFDGISYYYVAGSSGLVSVHQVDYHTPVMPPEYQVSWSKALSGLVVPVAGAPAGIPAAAAQAPPPMAASTSSGGDAPKRPATSTPRVPPVVARAADEGDASASPKQANPRKKERKAPAFLRQCEYAWDCEAPMECCEFGGASFCCRGGVGQLVDNLLDNFRPQPQPQPQMIPIPVPVPKYPQGYPGRYP